MVRGKNVNFVLKTFRLTLKRKFLTNLALLLFLNLLVKPFWIFGIDREVQNTTGAGEYGLYFALFSFSILVNILLDAGITNYNNRKIARDHSSLAESLSVIIPVKLMLGVVYSLVVLAAGLSLGYDSRQFHMLIFLAGNQFLLSFILYLRSNLSGLHLFRTDSLLSVLDRLLLIIICSLLLWGNIIDKPFRIEWFVYAQTIAYMLTAFIIFLVVLSKSGRFRLNFNIKESMGILRQSYPYALVILMMAFFNRIDSVMLERMLPEGNREAGIYAQSFRILDAASMFAFLFASLLLPIFAKMIKGGENPGEMVRMSFSLIIIPALALCLLSLIYSEEIMGLLYQEETLYSASVYRILIFCYLFISVSYIFGTLLTANGSMRQLNLLAFATLILNFVLNLILIPSRKAEGAAIAAVISQGFYAVSQMLVSGWMFKLRFNLSLTIRLLVLILSLSGTALILETIPLHWLAGSGIIIAFSVLFAWYLKIYQVKALTEILKNKE